MLLEIYIDYIYKTINSIQMSDIIEVHLYVKLKMM